MTTIDDNLKELIISLCEYVCETEYDNYMEVLMEDVDVTQYAYNQAAAILAELKR